ncbi:hypothetical protein DLL96_24325 [Salmonella enterica subsp. enterica serovar Bredeney]|nr:hypothetical protein [Salmonella enterica subsp. enterica serovar Bredeney]
MAGAARSPQGEDTGHPRRAQRPLTRPERPTLPGWGVGVKGRRPVAPHPCHVANAGGGGGQRPPPQGRAAAAGGTRNNVTRPRPGGLFPTGRRPASTGLAKPTPKCALRLSAPRRRGRQSGPIPETEREIEKAKQDVELGIAV